ncbi:peptidase inhibitor family I36 protein [Streptomyces sp. RLB1-33]|nr:peptidase inhibitor family I36 protein [Streptomyces sp. RLB1-33]QIY67997.1 peptidase inhibitor family I36 protein [Streptomyces sp. RLB1-33]
MPTALPLRRVAHGLGAFLGAALLCATAATAQAGAVPADQPATKAPGALGTVALLAGASFTQAHASGPVTSSGLSSCPSGYACFWAWNQYAGNMGKVAGNNPDYRALRSSEDGCISGTWNNCIRSVANRGTQCTVYFYDDYNYGKSHSWHSLSRGDQVGDFLTGYNDYNFEDAISSNKWCSS